MDFFKDVTYREDKSDEDGLIVMGDLSRWKDDDETFMEWEIKLESALFRIYGLGLESAPKWKGNR